MIQNILVAVDGSEPANKALEFALDLAEKHSATLVLVNVYSKLIPFIYKVSMETSMQLPGIDEYFQHLEESHKSMLEEKYQNAKKRKPNVNISKKLVEGHPPARKIVEIAREENFDLIVMGHRGLSGIKELVLGSVSNRVAHDAECPVLIVK